MSVADILTRANAVYNKYEKYDLDRKGADQEVHKGDRFLQEYTDLQADIEAALQKSSDASIEKNRAVVATINAEIRRSKGAMRAKLPKLQKHALKKVKGIKPEDLAIRPDMVLAITAKIEEIPDGIVMLPKAKGKRVYSRSKEASQEIRIDSMSPGTSKLPGGNADDILKTGTQQHSEESEKFAQEADQRKGKQNDPFTGRTSLGTDYRQSLLQILQDESLEYLSEGLTTLGNLAQDINEELDRQAPLADEIDSKVSKAQTELKNTNTRLKETLFKLRSSRNFVVDVILLLVILSIASVLYKVITSKKHPTQS